MVGTPFGAFVAFGIESDGRGIENEGLFLAEGGAFSFSSAPNFGNWNEGRGIGGEVLGRGGAGGLFGPTFEAGSTIFSGLGICKEGLATFC